MEAKKGTSKIWSFESLEGTQKERDELIKKFAGWGWTSTDFTAQEATKEALLNIQSPYILHLATHGFFAKEDPSATQTGPEALLSDRQSVTKSKFFKNPMQRSGLALAGAQTTIEAWKQGKRELEKELWACEEAATFVRSECVICYFKLAGSPSTKLSPVGRSSITARATRQNL